jgi:hypothetical protein
MYRRSSRFTTAPTPSFATLCITSPCPSVTRRTRGLPSDSSPALTLQRRPRSPGSGTARRRPLPGFFPARGRGGLPGTFRPTATSRTALGTVFPWPAASGFCMPSQCSRPRLCWARPQPLSAVQIRPLGLRPQGLGGALRRLITATSQSKLIPPPPPTALLRICVGVISHVFVPTISPPT